MVITDSIEAAHIIADGAKGFARIVADEAGLTKDAEYSGWPALLGLAFVGYSKFAAWYNTYFQPSPAGAILGAQPIRVFGRTPYAGAQGNALAKAESQVSSGVSWYVKEAEQALGALTHW